MQEKDYLNILANKLYQRAYRRKAFKILEVWQIIISKVIIEIIK